MSKVKVLMVCMGNICRSPLAHGLFENMVREAGLDEVIVVDSAGTHAYHVGEQPDPRSQEVALRNSIDLSYQRARKVNRDDFGAYDYVLAMDRENYHNLMRICPDEHVERVRMFMEYAPDVHVEEVPDPYYGGANGFDYVFDLVKAASEGLLEEIRRKHNL